MAEALGATGMVTGVETSLPAALSPFILPASPTRAELRSAIRASLAVLDLAPDRVTVDAGLHRRTPGVGCDLGSAG